MSLPTRGLCHSVFLLTYSALAKPRKTTLDWIAAARRVPTIMANALGIDEAAGFLVQLGLVTVDEQGVHVDGRLANAGNEASNETLTAIARILLNERPPAWLNIAVADDLVRPELIPFADESALAWLEDLRDPLLVDLKHDNDESANFRSWLGSVGEDLVVESETLLGRKVRQVSLLSDSFGYDVESTDTTRRRCIEVKTTVESASNRFFITKNELSKAAVLKEDWSLVQVVFHQDAVVRELINRNHILQSRFLEAATVVALAPTDTATGEWVNSARITPPTELWSTWELSAPPSWSYRGYGVDRK